MSEQRIYLDEDDKLVIKTDNGTQNINGTTTKVTGEFTVSAEDVVKLFAIVNKKDVVYPPYIHRHYYGLWNKYPQSEGVIVTHDENTKEVIEAASKDIEEKIIKITALDKEIREKNDEIVVLRQKINAFNGSRYWWERKIKID